MYKQCRRCSQYNNPVHSLDVAKIRGLALLSRIIPYAASTMSESSNRQQTGFCSVAEIKHYTAVNRNSNREPDHQIGLLQVCLGGDPGISFCSVTPHMVAAHWNGLLQLSI